MAGPGPLHDADCSPDCMSRSGMGWGGMVCQAENCRWANTKSSEREIKPVCGSTFPKPTTPKYQSEQHLVLPRPRSLRTIPAFLFSSHMLGPRLC